MPFKSSKQERYMWAKHPQIAKKWAKKYGSILHEKVKNKSIFGSFDEETAMKMKKMMMEDMDDITPGHDLAEKKKKKFGKKEVKFHFKSLSLEAQAEKIRSGLRSLVDGKMANGAYCWISDIYDDYVVLSSDGKNYKADWGKNSDGTFWLANSSDWVEVERSWEEVDMKEITLKKFGRGGKRGFAMWTPQMRSQAAKKGWMKRGPSPQARDGVKRFAKSAGNVLLAGTAGYLGGSGLRHAATYTSTRHGLVHGVGRAAAGALIASRFKKATRGQKLAYGMGAVAGVIGARTLGRAGRGAIKGLAWRTGRVRSNNGIHQLNPNKKKFRFGRKELTTEKAKFGGKRGFASWTPQMRSSAAKKGWMKRARASYGNAMRKGGVPGAMVRGYKKAASATHGLYKAGMKKRGVFGLAKAAGRLYGKAAKKTSGMYRAGMKKGGVFGAAKAGAKLYGKAAKKTGAFYKREMKRGGVPGRYARAARGAARLYGKGLRGSARAYRAAGRGYAGAAKKTFGYAKRLVGKEVTEKAGKGGKRGFASWTPQMRSAAARKGWMKRGHAAANAVKGGVQKAGHAYAGGVKKSASFWKGAAKKGAEKYIAGVKHSAKVVPGALKRAAHIADRSQRFNLGYQIAKFGVKRAVAKARFGAKIVRGAAKITRKVGGAATRHVAKKYVDYYSKEFQAPASLMVTKENDTYRWTLLSSNAFEDRDKQIVSIKALQNDVAKWDLSGQPQQPLRWWHVPLTEDYSRGVELGSCDFRMMHGKTLIESGTFLTKEIGEAVYNNRDKLAASIGFRHSPAEPDKDGVFTNISVFERSLLPKENASNPLTTLFVS